MKIQKTHDCAFCQTPVNTNLGLMSKNLDTSVFKKKLKYSTETGMYFCPLGFKNNPKNKKATVNVISNGGRNTICFRNPWRYEKV